jgi:hypothetical protein
MAVSKTKKTTDKSPANPKPVIPGKVVPTEKPSKKRDASAVDGAKEQEPAAKKVRSKPGIVDYSRIQNMIDNQAKVVRKSVLEEAENLLLKAVMLSKICDTSITDVNESFDQKTLKDLSAQAYGKMVENVGCSTTQAYMMTELINVYLQTNNCLTPSAYKAIQIAVNSVCYERFRKMNAITSLRPLSNGSKSDKNKKSDTSTSGVTATKSMTVADFDRKVGWKLHGESYEEEKKELIKFVSRMAQLDPNSIEFLQLLLSEQYTYAVDDSTPEEIQTKRQQAVDEISRRAAYCATHPECDIHEIFKKDFVIPSNDPEREESDDEDIANSPDEQENDE